MAKTVAIGQQDFVALIEHDYFYIDKTDFIHEWWENGDSVTLITRPRRFGKTLNMSMLEEFFSLKYAGRSDLFQNLRIWNHEKYRSLQGTCPVISLSFAAVKENTYENTIRRLNQILTDLYQKHIWLLETDCLTEKEKEYFDSVRYDMNEVTAGISIQRLTDFLYRYYGKKVIILLDEYDTPMQEAYLNGFWDEITAFTRSLFNASFKTNPCLERAVMTGITRVSKESVFSDLNNLEIVTTSSEKYETSFGFTEEEVFHALDSYGLSENKQDVKTWYDGFVFGRKTDIYNPWSIINYLDKQKLTVYWANTSSNSLAGRVIREGSPEIKTDFELLLTGGALEKRIDEQIIFSQLSEGENAVWSLLLASGYLKSETHWMDKQLGDIWYRLSLTNLEVRIMFRQIIRSWFAKTQSGYNSFIRALLKHDLKAMNAYMNQVALATFSFFDSGTHPSERTEPERFYHGFVLGLIVELADRYTITSNRESGLGRYYVMLEPKNRQDDAMLLEFKVYDPEEEKTLQDTAMQALRQIEERNYSFSPETKGFLPKRIRKYGFAFKGKQVLIKG